MPVVTIECLPPPDNARIDRVLAAVPALLGAAINCPTGDIWVYYTPVAAARSGDTARSFTGHSPIVTVRARAWRTEEQVRAGLVAVATAVSESLGVPLDDVWVHWLEVPPGRVYSGSTIGEFEP